MTLHFFPEMIWKKKKRNRKLCAVFLFFRFDGKDNVRWPINNQIRYGKDGRKKKLQGGGDGDTRNLKKMKRGPLFGRLCVWAEPHTSMSAARNIHNVENNKKINKIPLKISPTKKKERDVCVSREEIERRSLVSDWLCTIFTTSVVSARREWWHITRNRQPLRPLVGMAGSRCYFAMERASAERAGACVSVNDEKQHGRPGRISLSLPDTPWWLLYFLIARLVPFGIHFCCWKQKNNVCLFLRTIYWSILSGGHLGRLSWIDQPNIKNAANIFQLFF